MKYTRLHVIDTCVQKVKDKLATESISERLGIKDIEAHNKTRISLQYLIASKLQYLHLC